MTLLAAASGLSSAPLWYTTRATGIIAFVLLTLTTVLGIASTQRAMASRAWPRFATQSLHRNLSILGVLFLVAHVLTTLVDSFVNVSWWSVLVPGVSSYQRLGVSLGTLAFDVLLVVMVTSLLRHRISARLWRAVHWVSYAIWPLALVHFLRSGTDAAHGGWGVLLGALSLVLVGAATTVRLLSTNRPHQLRSVAGSRR
jgi:predicted ferric reductase